ncbi:MAG: hypothetical protein RML12_06045 [Xanthomonadales bacterium]|nr:hypothetical protein [Xanthomonadales bacterium]
MTAIERLRGALPRRDKRISSGTPRTAAAARAFVAELPPADLVQSAQRLLDTVDDLNRSRLRPAARLALLEALRPGVRQLAETMEKQLGSVGLPLPPVRLALAQRVLELQGELALGYQEVVLDSIGRRGRPSWWTRRRVRVALQRAIHHRGLAIAGAYLLFRAPRPGEWAALHDLARLAHDLGLASLPVEDPLEKRRCSPEQSFGEIVLLALCNPYRFSQREQLQLRRAMPWMIAECRLGLGLSTGFPIPEGEDRPPGHPPEGEEEAGRPAYRLDLGALAGRFEAELGQGADLVEARGLRGGREPLPAYLARRCLQSWQAESARVRRRLPGGHRLDLVVGLSQLRLALGAEEPAPARQGAAAARPRGEKLALGSAEVRDQSLGGYLLSWTPRDPIKVRVGEVVGLALPVEDEREREWMLGTVRWLRFAAGERLEFGVELLSFRPFPVAVELRAGSAPGLLFAPLRPGAAAPQLLVPATAESVLAGRGEVVARSEGAAAEVAWPPGHRAKLVEALADYLVLEPVAAEAAAAAEPVEAAA